MSKRGRDDVEELGWQSYVKQQAHAPAPCVNPIEIMMQAARFGHQKAHNVAQGPAQAAARTPLVAPGSTQGPECMGLVPCTHCGIRMGATQLRQCDSCQDVYCSMCSVSNYDERDDRVFCLDCNNQAQTGGYVGGTHVPVPASPQVNGCTPFRSPMPQYGSPSPWNTGSRVGCGTHTPLSAGGPFGRLGF